MLICFPSSLGNETEGAIAACRISGAGQFDRRELRPVAALIESNLERPR
jgi:hypothetical protein